MLNAEPAEDDILPSKLVAEIVGPASKPWFVYPMLAAAIVSVSSAAVVFSSMSEITPFLLASWRLQFTSALLVPVGVQSLIGLKTEERHRTLREFPLIGLAGVLLGAHFGSWVECIENTSLTHALLIGSSPPIIIAIGMLLTRKPISVGELVGTGIAGIGALVITQSASSEQAVSLYGDCIGFLSAGFFVIYLMIGRSMREWMPIFAYVLPVNAIAALTLCCGALLREGARFNTSPLGLFGYMGSKTYLWRSFYLGAVPGIAGHVSFNALLKWLHPLLIALPGTCEPIIGTLLGLLVGIGTLPGLFTYLGGGILIFSTVMVILASYRREKAAALAVLETVAGEVALAETIVPDLEEAEAESATDETEEQVLLNPTRVLAESRPAAGTQAEIV